MPDPSQGVEIHPLPLLCLSRKDRIAFMDNNIITAIFEGDRYGDPREEILKISVLTHPEAAVPLISQAHEDLTRIYSGTFPGFRLSTTKYPNLRHARMVALASIRLFHGLYCEGRVFSPETLSQGLLSAYFHDTGMLLTDTDTALTGSEYIKYHEERSITFVQRYIESSNLPIAYADNCALIIRCTDLNRDPRTFSFPTEEIQLAGQIVGSADLLAQMADRYYLERLPLLFQEQKEGDAHQHDSPLELMQRTAQFYHTTITERLRIVFADISQAMRSHFQHRWSIEKDLYSDSIQKNVAYLETIIARCKSEQDCLKKHLRRIPPTPSS